MTEDQLALQDCLFRRVGELHSHLCRYDVYLHCLVKLLTRELVLCEFTESATVGHRAETISRLMTASALPEGLALQFTEIHAEMQPILQRQSISARNAVLKAHIDIALPPDLSMPRPHTRNWLDPQPSPSAEEMLLSLAAIERDILSAVKLYLQIATLTKRIERHCTARPTVHPQMRLQR